MTTGGSTRETIDVARAAGAVVVGAAAIIDRSSGRTRPARVEFDDCAVSSRPRRGLAAHLRSCVVPVVPRRAACREAWIADRVRTLKLTLAYDGTPFVGWQRQAEGVSIQGLLEDALARLEGAPVTVHGAGRTDAGVHALGQVASAQITASHPVDVVARGAECVPAAGDQGDRRRGGGGRLSRPVQRALQDLSLRDSQRADRRARSSAPTSGTSRTRSIATRCRRRPRRWSGRTTSRRSGAPGGDVKTTTRTIDGIRRFARADAGPTPRTTLLVYEITGDGFLRHMVRAIVGHARRNRPRPASGLVDGGAAGRRQPRGGGRHGPAAGAVPRPGGL